MWPLISGCCPAWLRRAAGIYLLVIAAGIVAFSLSSRSLPVTDTSWPASEPPRDAEERLNWASLYAGARVRASSWDNFHSHHPLFLIDGEASPTELEKWASLPATPFPWLEILFSGRHEISELVIRHAGWRETTAYTNDRYTLRCYSGKVLLAEFEVKNNTAPVARHTIACSGADRLRVTFDCTGPVNVARIYEVEAWGR